MKTPVQSDRTIMCVVGATLCKWGIWEMLVKKKSTAGLLIVDDGERCPDLEYATGFRAPGLLTYVSGAGGEFLIVPSFELARARRACAEYATRIGKKPVNVVIPRELKLNHARKERLSEWVLSLLRAQGIGAVTIPARFPYGVARRLERAGIKLEIATGPLFPQRAVKTSDEIRKITESQQAAVIAMRAAVEVIHESEVDPAGILRLRGRRITSESVRDLITRVLLEHQCMCRETIVAGGPQAADPHERGEGYLRAGQTIVMDIFPQHLEHGYCGDLTRTVIKGTPNKMLKAVYNGVLAAQTAALKRLGPGVRGSTIHGTVENEFLRRGFRTGGTPEKAYGFTHSTGHGVGLAIHEFPSLGGSPEKLRRGNVVTVEPGLYYPDIGGVRIEDTVLITATGWRYLVPCEKIFEV